MSDPMKQRVQSGGQEFEVREMTGRDVLAYAQNPRVAKLSEGQLGVLQMIRCTHVIDLDKKTKLEDTGFEKLTYRQITDIRQVFGKLNIGVEPEQIIGDAAKTLLDMLEDIPENIQVWLESRIPKESPPLVETPGTD
jgi:hypothetical protein